MFKMSGKILKFHLDDEWTEVEFNSDETILETLLIEGYDPPFSCQSASCATCMAKLVSGEVEMDARYALSDEEVQSGYILTCQSRLRSDVVEIDYDV